MNIKKVLAVLMAVAMIASLAACGSSSTSAAETAASEAETAAVSVEASVEEAAADAPDAGFEEIPIFEDEEVGNLLNVSAVYFQPVPMAPDNESTEGFDMHLECDVSALPNELGYGVGDWVPYLTVDYDVVGSDGSSAASGTFMVMSASDGPHYGANIALPNADTYSITFTFHSPAENGYLIHSDAETGPGKVLDDYFGNGPLTVTFDGWEYAPTEW